MNCSECSKEKRGRHKHICNACYLRAWHKRNPGKNSKYTKKWYNENKDKHKQSVLSYREENRDKYLAWGADYRELNREELRAWHRQLKIDNPSYYFELTLRRNLKKYNVTREDYEEMREKGCTLCVKPFTKTPNFDHCHETGKFRGLLCVSCNMALGLLHDDIDLLKRAITYLLI